MRLGDASPNQDCFFARGDKNLAATPEPQGGCDVSLGRSHHSPVALPQDCLLRVVTTRRDMSIEGHACMKRLTLIFPCLPLIRSSLNMPAFLSLKNNPSFKSSFCLNCSYFCDYSIHIFFFLLHSVMIFLQVCNCDALGLTI